MASIFRRLLSYSSEVARTSSLLEISDSIRRRSVTALSNVSNLILRHQQEEDPLPMHKVDDLFSLMGKNSVRLILNPFVRRGHWLVHLPRTTRFKFAATEEDLINIYVQTLATACCFTEEEARKRIYLVSVAEPFGFGAKFDLQTRKKLEAARIIDDFVPDYFCYKKTPPVQKNAKFTSRNLNHRLENIFMYHHLSTPNSSEYPWGNNYWLINIKEPDSGFSSSLQVLRHYKNLLADVLGSEEDAEDSIYVAWVKAPFGFGAKIAPQIAEELKGRLDVLHVLPDYAFDVNGDCDDALIIYPPSHGKQIGASGFLTYSGLKDVSRDRVTDMDKQTFSTYSGLENDLSGSYLPECNWNVDCKNWFVSVEKPVDDSVSMQRRIDTYIKTLAMVIGSEKAKKNIYRIKYDNQISGFAARMDVHTSNKLKGVPGVVAVVPDHLFSNSHPDDFSAINVIKEMKVNLKSWKLTQ